MYKLEDSDSLQPLRSSGSDPELLLTDDEDSLRLMVLRITAALVGSCKHCLMISTDIADDAPIYCGKSNDLCYMRKINVESCLDCGEYKNRAPSLEPNTPSGR
ncbi:hypothetical protein FE782_12285 [Paenibacillus antri]|uniref:Uncharacterized protein n=1 Tax=Paenibacillus antri TaxID=2582848 RepID=A0A5R9G6U6_9BACL|nr:hypothetical protein [Paenibacillus antri]TLS52132.1 hypothetical protein FE782_12285 [Paenibacillus antri]